MLITQRGQPAGPSIELVVAVSDNDVIGRGNQLPWHLSDDLKRFKNLTLGKPILMGRKTYESIGKALPGRLNLVMSRSAGFAPADAVVVSGVEAARAAAGAAPGLMVIGGSEIYALALPAASRIHLTLVHTRIEDGDAFFRGWRGPQWLQESSEEHAADARHAYPFSFLTLVRR
jgi:dihydrofolate reductase